LLVELIHPALIREGKYMNALSQSGLLLTLIFEAPD